MLSDTDDCDIGDIPEPGRFDLLECQPAGFGDFGLFHIQRGVFFVKKLLQEIFHIGPYRHRIDALCHQFGGSHDFVGAELEKLLLIFEAFGVGDDEVLPSSADLLFVESDRSNGCNIVSDIIGKRDHPFGTGEVRFENTRLRMRLFTDKVGVVVFFGNLFEVFSGIDHNKGNMVGTKLFGDLYRKVVVVADDKVVFEPCDLIKHAALLGNFLKFSPLDHFGDNTYGDREDHKAENDQGNRKDTSCIGDGMDLSKTDRRKCDPRLVDRIHQRKVIDDHIAERTDQHDQYSENEWESEGC